MSGTALRRMIGGGWQNFTRGGAVSIATVMVMTVTLGIISSLIFLSALLTFTLNSITQKINVAVYFITSASETDILALKNKIEQLPQVADVSYTSREQALADFKELHATDQPILQGLAELDDNPLEASLAVRAKDPSQYEAIASTLSTTPALSSGGTSIIDRVNYLQTKEVKRSIDNLSSIISATREIGLIIILIFAIASVLIAYATIQLAIYTARDEIGVMRLVGASNAYIRGPFIVAGIIAGVLAAVIVLLLIWPVSWYLSVKTALWLQGFSFYGYFISHLLLIVGVVVGSGIVLGGLPSIFAIRSYLKV
jgi:cell division transport system permease protein